MEATDLARATIQVASTQVGEAEVWRNQQAPYLPYSGSGGVGPGPSNWSPKIAEYLASAHLTDPASWCSAFAAWCIKSAAAKSGVVSSMKFSASALHFFSLNPDLQFTTLAAEEIPCVGILDEGGGLGHVVLVCGLSDSGMIDVIAGNTNDNGSRSGTGVFSLEGRYSVTDPMWAGYLRIV